jgi:sugar phosphate isomerase/epimerase
MRLAHLVCTPDVNPRPGQPGMRGDLATCFAQLAQIGYQGVELSIADPARVLPLVPEIKRLAEGYRLHVAAIATDEMAFQGGLSLGSDDLDLAFRSDQQMREAVKIAGELGCSLNIGLVRGRMPDGGAETYQTAKMVAAILGTTGLGPFALENGVRLTVEPIPPPAMDWICDTATAVNVIVRVNRPVVRILLSSAQVTTYEASTAGAVEKAAPFLQHVHLSEEDGSVPGRGTADIAGLVSELGKVGYRRWLSVVAVGDNGYNAARDACEHMSGILPRHED